MSTESVDLRGHPGLSERKNKLYADKLEACLCKMPLAGSGFGFNDHALPQAVGYAKKAGLSQQEAFDRIYATQGNASREPSDEIRSTIERIYASDDESHRQTGKLHEDSGVSVDVNDVLKENSFTVAKLKEQSPLKGQDQLPVRDVLGKILPGCPILTVARKAKNGLSDTTKVLSAFDEPFLKTQEYFVPSAAIKHLGKNQKGEDSKRCEELYPKRQNLDIEFDHIKDKDAQAAIIWHLTQFAPLLAVVDSGNKSLHALYNCEGASPEDVEDFFRYAVALGADPSLRKPEHLGRLPNGTRSDNGAKQPVLYLDPTAIGREWTAEALPTKVQVRSIMEIPNDVEDSETNLIGERFLTRKRAIEVVGQTGVGKSVLLMQMAMVWSAGKNFMGIRPQSALRILLVQAENDDEDLRKMRDGVIAGCGLESDLGLIQENFHYCAR
jgi:hypothetical protein